MTDPRRTEARDQARRADVRPLDAQRLGPQAVRRELGRAGIAARHALSQNFLADGEVLETIVHEADAALVEPTMADPELAKKMQAAGVTGPPQVWVI